MSPGLPTSAGNRYHTVPWGAGTGAGPRVQRRLLHKESCLTGALRRWGQSSVTWEGVNQKNTDPNCTFLSPSDRLPRHTSDQTKLEDRGPGEQADEARRGRLQGQMQQGSNWIWGKNRTSPHFRIYRLSDCSGGWFSPTNLGRRAKISTFHLGLDSQKLLGTPMSLLSQPGYCFSKLQFCIKTTRDPGQQKCLLCHISVDICTTSWGPEEQGSSPGFATYFQVGDSGQVAPPAWGSIFFYL